MTPGGGRSVALVGRRRARPNAGGESCGGRSGAFVYAGFGSVLRKTGGTTASRNLASEDRFRAALEGFAGADATIVVEDYPRETHGTIAVPVFHEAMKRLLIGGAAAGR